MAIQWSGYDSSGNNAMRVGIDVSVGSVSASSSSCKVTFKIWTGNRYNYNQTGQKLTYSGTAGSGSKTFSNTQGSGTTTLRDTQTYTYSYPSSGAGASRTFTAKLSGTYNGSTPSKTVTVTIPKRPISAPAAPTGITGSRGYSTSATVRWTNNATTARPYTSMTLQRQARGSSTWTTVWTGTGTSRTVTGLSLATDYRFRVRATNSAGSSGWNTSGYFSGVGVPAAPTGFTVTRNSDTNFSSKWTNRSTTAAPYTSLTMQRQVDNGAWTSWWSSSSIVSSHTISTSLTANHVYRFRLRANNAAGSSGWVTSGYVYNTPGAPTGATATLGTNGRVTVKWTNKVNYSGYYLQVQRLVGGTWSFVNSNLAGGSTSWADTSPAAGTAIQYRVRAVSTVGTLTSAWATTSALSTAPNPPTSVKAATQANNTIRVTWTNQTRYTTYTTSIQRSVAGGTWTTVASNLASGVTSWTDSSPGAGTNQYRVRHNGIASQVSAWANSNTVSTIVAPKAPTGLSPNGQTIDLSADQPFTWTHVDGGDGSDQSKYQVRISSDGGSTWTTYPETTSEESLYTLPAGTLANGQTYQWQVRTQGIASVGWGPWSGTATFTGSSAPVVTITVPTDPQTTSPLTAEWEYDQAEMSPQARWEAVLYDSRQTPLESLSGNGDAGTARFSSPLEQGETYTVRVRAQSGAGLWSSWASQTFRMDLLPPAEVILDPTYDGETGTTTIGITGLLPEDDVSAPIDHIDLQRRITPCLGPGYCDDDNLGEEGEWTTIVTGIQLPSDYEPGVPAGVNMIPDPSIEYTEEFGYAGFEPNGNADLASDLDHVHTGEQALRIDTIGAGTNAVVDPTFTDLDRNLLRFGADVSASAGVVSVGVPNLGSSGPRFWLIGDLAVNTGNPAPTSGWQPVAAGETWQFSVEVNPDLDQANLRVQINWVLGNGTSDYVYPVGDTKCPEAEWTTLSGSAVAPANATGVYFALVVTGSQGHFTMQIRNPYASRIRNQVEDPTFLDVDLNTQRFGPYSTEEVLRTNLAMDPSLSRATPWSTGGAATVTTATDWAKFGTTSCKVVSTGSSAAAAYVPSGAAGVPQIEVTPGQVVTASAYWHTDAASLAGVRPFFYISMTYGDGTEGNSGFARSDEGDPNALDGRCSVTFTVPQNALRYSMRMMNASATTGATIWWDGLLIEVGEEVGDYFDGDTAPAGEVSCRWKGDPGTSSSEQYVPASGASIANGVATVQATGGLNTGPRYWVVGNRAPANSTAAPTSGWLPVTGGDEWLFSVDVNPAIAYKLRIQINWRFADGTQGSATYPGMGTYPANTWSTITGSIVAPANAIGVYVAVICDANQATTTLQIRNPSAAQITGMPGVFARAIVQVEQGKRYTFSGWRYSETSSAGAVPVNLAVGGSAATDGAIEQNTDPTSTGQWQFLQATIAASADGPTYLYLYGSAADGAAVTWDDLGFTEGTDAVDFNGDIESDGAFNYAWTGEPGNSDSVQTDAGIVTNMAIDPSLSGAAAWTSASGATVTVDDTEWAKFGDTSMKIVSAGASGAAAYVPATTGPQIRVIPGPTVVSAYWHTDPGGEDSPITGLRPFFSINMEFDDGTTAVANYAQSNQGDPTEGDGRCACLFNVPDNCARWSVRLINGSATTGATIWWDGLLIQTGHEVNDYFDGDTPQDYDYSYHWTGDPGVSPSERIAQPNLAVLDTQPITCGVNEYRAIVTSTAPSQAVSDSWEVDADGVGDGQWLFLSWGDGFSLVARASCDPQTGETIGRNRAVQPLLGAHRPVLLVGTNTNREISVAAELAWGRYPGDGSSPVTDFRTAARESELVLYRDYTGRRVYGMMSELQVTDGVPGMAGISFTVTEARHIEALAFIGGQPYEPNTGSDDGGEGVDNDGGTYDVDDTGIVRGFRPLADMPVASASPGQSL